jgi:hypothetical protein
MAGSTVLATNLVFGSVLSGEASGSDLTVSATFLSDANEIASPPRPQTANGGSPAEATALVR